MRDTISIWKLIPFITLGGMYMVGWLVERFWMDLTLEALYDDNFAKAWEGKRHFSNITFIVLVIGFLIACINLFWE